MYPQSTAVQYESDAFVGYCANMETGYLPEYGPCLTGGKMTFEDAEFNPKAKMYSGYAFEQFSRVAPFNAAPI